MKVIHYRINGIPVTLDFDETNMAIAGREADGGLYTVEEVREEPAQLLRELTTQELLRLALGPVLQSIPDEKATRMVSSFPELAGNGELVSAGTRINWKGTLKRAAADLWDTPENTPEAAPDLWEDIAYRSGQRIIPAQIAPGTAFSAGEYGWWGDGLYQSLLDANVWTPEQNPGGWERIR